MDQLLPVCWQSCLLGKGLCMLFSYSACFANNTKARVYKTGRPITMRLLLSSREVQMTILHGILVWYLIQPLRLSKILHETISSSCPLATILKPFLLSFTKLFLPDLSCIRLLRRYRELVLPPLYLQHIILLF